MAVLEWLESAAPFSFTVWLTRPADMLPDSQVLEQCIEASTVTSCSWAEWATLQSSMSNADPVLWMDLRLFQGLELSTGPCSICGGFHMRRT